MPNLGRSVVHGADARQMIKDGIDILANAVKVTLGPKGRNVVIDSGVGGPSVTKDGVTVARAVILGDRLKNIGADLVKEVASKTNDMAGDGTTTACVLAQSIVTDGFRALANGANPVLLKRGIDAEVKALVGLLKAAAIPIATHEQIEQIASISANDKEIGRQIAEAMREVSAEVGNVKDVVIAVEDSNTFGISREVVKGMRFDRGYLSPHMITDEEKRTSELTDPYVLVTDHKITAAETLIPVVQAMLQEGKKELLVIAQEISGTALVMLIMNRLRGIFTGIAVRAPGFGDSRRDILEDIAAVTGGTFISEEAGMKLEDVKPSELGKAHRVTCTKDHTTIVEGGGTEDAIKGRIGTIRSAIEKAENDYDKEKLRDRLAKLSGGVAVIKVGAATETEVKEIKDRIEDAINATKAAVEEGIVPGGGLALLRVGRSRVSEGVTLDDEEIGKRIVLLACEAPLKQIAQNAGKSWEIVLNKVLTLNQGVGYDAEKDSYDDMVTAGIVDPLKVTRTALENAASIASLVLTTEAAVFDTENNNATIVK